MAECKVKHTRLVKNLKLGDLVRVIKYSHVLCDMWAVVTEENNELVDIKTFAGTLPVDYEIGDVFYLEDWGGGADKWWRFTLDDAPDEVVAAYTVWRMGGGDA